MYRITQRPEIDGMFSRCVSVKYKAEYKPVMSNDGVVKQRHDGDVTEDNTSLW